MSEKTTGLHERTHEEASTERAVSPVIGVILMVAITVVLAGVIGIMVFGIADDLGDSTPSATLSIDDVTAIEGPGEEESDLQFTIEHDGGDSVVIEDLNVIVDGSTVDNARELAEPTPEEGEELSAGESITVEVEENGEDFEAPGEWEDVTIALNHGPSDSVLGSYDIQSNDIDDGEE